MDLNARKPYSNCYAIVTFLPLLPGAEVVSSHVPVGSKHFVQNWIFLLFTQEHLEELCHILQADMLCVFLQVASTCVPITVLFNFLAAATILQCLILHLPNKKSTPGVIWLQI